MEYQEVPIGFDKVYQTKNWSHNLKGDFWRYNGFSCSLEGGSAIGYTLGYEDAPVNYIDADVIKEREITSHHCIQLRKNEKITFRLFLYDFEANDERGISQVIRDVYKRYHQKPRSGASPKEAVEDISTAIYKDSYLADIRNYATMVSIEENTVKKLTHTSISWTGGVEIATPLLMSALRLNEEDVRRQALECIQNIVDNSLNSRSGLPFDAFMDGKMDDRRLVG
jgi:hypothetical protein